MDDTQEKLVNCCTLLWKKIDVTLRDLKMKFAFFCQDIEEWLTKFKIAAVRRPFQSQGNKADLLRNIEESFQYQREVQLELNKLRATIVNHYLFFFIVKSIFFAKFTNCSLAILCVFPIF